MLLNLFYDIYFILERFFFTVVPRYSRGFLSQNFPQIPKTTETKEAHLWRIWLVLKLIWFFFKPREKLRIPNSGHKKATADIMKNANRKPADNEGHLYTCYLCIGSPNHSFQPIVYLNISPGYIAFPNLNTGN